METLHLPKQQYAPQKEASQSLSNNSESVADFTQDKDAQNLSQKEALIEDIATPSKPECVDDFLEKAKNEFQIFSGILAQNRELLYRALAYSYQYSQLVSEERLKEIALDRGFKANDFCKRHIRNKLIIDLACQEAVIEYPNLKDRKKIYTKVLDRLYEKDLSFDEALELLKKEGIENIARGKEKSSHLTDESKTEDDNGIAKNDDVSKDNNVTEEQKIIMKALFDNRKTNGIKANDCILLVLDGEVRYITREDILKDFEEFLSKKRSSVNGEPYKVLIEAPSD